MTPTEEETETLFDNCLTDEEMNQVLGEGKITVLISYDCYCYDECPRPSDVFDICGIQIKSWNIVQHLADKNWNPMCNHRFLEMFTKVRGNVWEPFMGS